MVELLHRIPALNNAEIRQMINGPESFTPDMSFCLGPVPEVSFLDTAEIRGAFWPCGHFDFASAVTAQNDEIKGSFHRLRIRTC